MLLVTDVRFSYPERQIFSALSFKADNGDVMIVLGPNGSGKTTLGLLLCGLLSPKSGTVSIHGERIHDKCGEERFRLAAFLPQRIQTYFLFPTVKREIRFATRYLSIEEKQFQSDVSECMAESMDMIQNPADLSPNESWRFALSLGLLARSRVLFIDEVPSLSSTLTQRVVQNLLKRRRQAGYITILAMHRQPQVFGDLITRTLELQ